MKETATKYVDKILQNLQENKEQFIELIVSTYETTNNRRKEAIKSGDIDGVIENAFETALKLKRIRKQKIDNGCDERLCQMFITYAMDKLENDEEEIDNVYSEVGDAK